MKKDKKKRNILDQYYSNMSQVSQDPVRRNPASQVSQNNFHLSHADFSDFNFDSNSHSYNPSFIPSHTEPAQSSQKIVMHDFFSSMEKFFEESFQEIFEKGKEMEREQKASLEEEKRKVLESFNVNLRSEAQTFNSSVAEDDDCHRQVIESLDDLMGKLAEDTVKGKQELEKEKEMEGISEAKKKLILREMELLDEERSLIQQLKNERDFDGNGFNYWV